MSALLVSAASATSFTTTSPTGGALPSGVTEIGGIVLDLLGLNGTRIVSQVAASSLYVGYASTNPQDIGTQTGFDAATIAALGGGLQSASVRLTLYDGDSAPGDFDDGTDNTLLVDGVEFGYFGSVMSQQTDSTGTSLLSSGIGFGNNILSTGFFSTSDAPQLASLYAGILADNAITFSLSDDDPYDNYYDFTQGVDGGLINIGSGPIVTPPGAVPEASTWAMMLVGAGLLGGALRQRRRITVSFA